ncbi:MAG: HAD-IIIA family hydrolase [Bacteroidia bacterium]|jgi:histidinol-phosphate phosphatase family protein|nr:HAD-IIIA family hydrolase [Bacteroidia bacterium]
MNEHKAYLPSRKERKGYTLFLDRDGVLNEPIVDDYARQPSDLILVSELANSIEALLVQFKRVILVTNQQGVGRKVMSDIDLEDVHLKMYNHLKNRDVQWFDAAFFAPYLKTENHTWRKPNNGMLHKARAYFPDIDWKKSIMVGDSPGDMQLADSLGIIKVRIANPQFSFDNQDFKFDTVADFVAAE